MAHRCLARAGFSVEVCSCIAQAMVWVERSWPDLVVLDPRLPGDDGFALQRLRAPSDVPVVMISPRGDEQERVWGLTLGADDFVPIPVSPEERVACVRSVLRRVGRDLCSWPFTLTLPTHSSSMSSAGGSAYGNLDRADRT